jgi:hypothetical protein
MNSTENMIKIALELRWSGNQHGNSSFMLFFFVARLLFFMALPVVKFNVYE